MAHDMDGDWDVIVIGAGMGGLVAAAYLAVTGRRALVLEQHDVAGGNTHVFRRRRSYEFDVGVHYLGDCGPDGLLPALLAGLGAADRITFRPMDSDCFDRIILPSVTVDVPFGWSRYQQRLTEALPADAAGIATFVRIASAAAAAARNNLIGPKSAPPGGEVLRWILRPVNKLYDHCGLSTRARTVINAQCGNYGAAPAVTPLATHATMLDDYLRGSYYPEGGGQQVAATLVEVLEAHGARLWTKATVSRIESTKGRVTGVRLADGTQLRAPIVISNADYRRTVLELAGGIDTFPELDVRRATNAEMRLPLAAVYVALDKELADVPDANYWYWPCEDVDEAFRKLADGNITDPQFVFLSFASLKDRPGGPACPPGQTNFQVMTLCPSGYEPWGLTGGPVAGVRYRRDPEYQRIKQQLTEALLDRAAEVIGPFRDHIVHVETSTPLTNERYTRSSGGTPYGMARWSGMAQLPDVVTAVDGLYVAGQSTRFGAGIVRSGVSGLACASAVLGTDLLREVHAGAVLGSPDLLPDRPGDWDPLRISRGAGRRGARGLAKLVATP
ncbi:MAG TPA: NAD(P)/FAD-dependent oxidoreductase [Pseudonocardiaceae bacterium]|nr:NAD(P)/FAD-dependent oxidoreductase [Pseudonocardiaceae bacterium]